jgi:hypothetical protein
MAATNTPRPVAADAVGNLLEWYDFAVYGYFAAAIGRAFFPERAAGLCASQVLRLVAAIEDAQRGGLSVSSLSNRNSAGQAAGAV